LRPQISRGGENYTAATERSPTLYCHVVPSSFTADLLIRISLASLATNALGWLT
jgi:hypothetical protein